MGCCASAIRSDYGEPVVHLPQKLAYIAKEALDYYESCAFALKHGLGALEAHNDKRRLAAADSVVQQSDCEHILMPGCELTAYGKLEHRLKQERAKAQKAQAAACQLAAQMIVSNAVKHAILHEQLANAAEAEACRVAARMMVTRAFSTAIHRDEMATLQQQQKQEMEAEQAVATALRRQVEEVQQAQQEAAQRHEAEMSAQKVQVVALKQQLLDLEHAKESMAQQQKQEVEAEQAVATALRRQLEEVQQAQQEAAQRHEAKLSAEKDQVVAIEQQCLDLEQAKESMAQEHEQEAQSMREQLRQQEEAVHALQDELATSQQEQQQSAEVAAHQASVQQVASEELETQLRIARVELQYLLRQVASSQGQHHQGSHAADKTTPPGSNARVFATPNSTQTSSGPGSTDESWQSSQSDHHRPDLTCDRTEDGNIENSLSDDDDDKEGVLSSFLPEDIPRLPHDIALKKASAVQVAQLASHQWHHRLLAILEHYHIPWKGSWDLTPLAFAPSVFALVAKSLSVIGQGSFGRVHFGQRWVGWGSPDSHQLGRANDWEPVAIKIVENSDHARREVTALRRVQQAVEQLPGSCHVIQLVEAHPHTKQLTGESQMHIITRYVEGHDLDDSFKWLRQKWSEQVGTDGERGRNRVQWLSAVKEATRQALQGLHVIHGCGLVHGDIKPNNFRVAMKPDGSQVHLIITDLGNSCEAGSECTCIMACAMYTSPEGLNYFKKPREYLIESAADIFSVACVLYELLTDQRAFVRPADGNVWDLTFEELLKVVLLRQRQWDADSARGHLLPYGLDALRESIPNDEDCRQAVDLLQSMLSMDPDQRPSAQEALLHPFLKL